MDALERQTLVRQLGRAVDELNGGADEMPACAWFFERELLAWMFDWNDDHHSPLYDVAAAAEKLGFDVADVYYDPDDPSAIVVESFGRRWRKPQPPV